MKQETGDGRQKTGEGKQEPFLSYYTKLEEAQRFVRACLTVLSVSCLLFLVSCLSAKAQGKPKAPPRVVSPWDVEAREYLGTPQSEAAVKKGLEFLATHQAPEGYWPREGYYRGNVAVTGLCLMSFLASGQQPGRGKYGVSLSQTVDYLANDVLMDGSRYSGYIHGTLDNAPAMYGQGFATLALAEAYGMTRRRDLRAKLEAAIHLIESTQNLSGEPRKDGGWRYQPNTEDADISVTVVQVLALRAARNAGLKVSQATVDRALAYMKRCCTNADGGVNYQVGNSESGPARTGAAILSFMMAGMRNAPECERAIQYLQNNPLYDNTVRGQRFRGREHFYYCIYYITQAMYQVGGERWKQWYPAVRNYLISTQNPDGSWTEHSEAGTSYATAMAVLVLQVPAGLLPIYQK